MGSVRETTGMPCQHSRANVVSAEEAPVVVENDLIEIIIVMKKGHLDRSRIRLNRPRDEGTHDEAIADPSRVRRWWQVVPV